MWPRAKARGIWVERKKSGTRRIAREVKGGVMGGAREFLMLLELVAYL